LKHYVRPVHTLLIFRLVVAPGSDHPRAGALEHSSIAHYRIISELGEGGMGGE